MNAMRALAARSPLHRQAVEIPEPGPGQALIRVAACGVCRTDLHLVDGELPACRYPVTPGHEIVGNVIAGAGRFASGTRVGVPWLGWACGTCDYCASGQENLCDRARFTGCHADGGYADYVVADERFCLPIPPGYSDGEAAPLLCAGLIGYRSYSFAGDAKRIGLYGFGAAAHILAQVARAEGRQVFAFTRPGDQAGRRFAIECGAHWAGDSTEAPPEPLDAAILFAPVGALVPTALQAVRKGGRVICGGIHMSDIPAFPYRILWGERRIESVANLTRADGERFMKLAGQVRLKTHVVPYPLANANQALSDLRESKLEGAAVLLPSA
jgi:propanol-preferring alcohol dehydrogenase